MNTRCGCEIGADCTKTTVCNLNLAVEQALEEQANTKEFTDEIVQYARDFRNASMYGRAKDRDTAHANLFEAVGLYETEIVD